MKTNILIVDDLPENLQALEAIIRNEDREIFQALSGAQALEVLLLNEFALVILDVQMPDMNGFELAELMRGTHKTRDIPIIFVTAAGKELRFAFRGYETGAVDFLYKPLDIEAVQSKVNVFVALHQQKQVIHAQLSLLKENQQELERLLHIRDEFMSMVAHELRTPLNTLVLGAQVQRLNLQRDNLAAFAPAELQKMLERNDRQYNSMMRLIDDMLDVTRMRSGKLSIRPAQMSLSDLLKHVVYYFTQIAKVDESLIRLHPHAPVNGVWDEHRIEQIIINLLTNAYRYGGGKPIEVSVTATETHVRVDVLDHGIGISQEDQLRIFDPFERAAGNKVAAGLGLGLYISKQLAVAHGGALTVQSTVSEQSVFSLTLPLKSDVASKLNPSKN